MIACESVAYAFFLVELVSDVCFAVVFAGVAIAVFINGLFVFFVFFS